MVDTKETAAWMIGNVAYCSEECARTSGNRGKVRPIRQDEFERLRERGVIGHTCNHPDCDELLPGV